MSVSLDIVAVVCGAVLALSWLFRLEGKIIRNQEHLNQLKDAIEKNVSEVNKIETKVIDSIDELRRQMTDLTINIARILERMEHINKRDNDWRDKDGSNPLA